MVTLAVVTVRCSQLMHLMIAWSFDDCWWCSSCWWLWAIRLYGGAHGPVDALDDCLILWWWWWWSLAGDDLMMPWGHDAWSVWWWSPCTWWWPWGHVGVDMSCLDDMMYIDGDDIPWWHDDIHWWRLLDEFRPSYDMMILLVMRIPSLPYSPFHSPHLPCASPIYPCLPLQNPHTNPYSMQNIHFLTTLPYPLAYTLLYPNATTLPLPKPCFHTTLSFYLAWNPCISLMLPLALTLILLLTYVSLLSSL